MEFLGDGADPWLKEVFVHGGDQAIDESRLDEAHTCLGDEAQTLWEVALIEGVFTFFANEVEEAEFERGDEGIDTLIDTDDNGEFSLDGFAEVFGLTALNFKGIGFGGESGLHAFGVWIGGDTRGGKDAVLADGLEGLGLVRFIHG